MPQSISKMSIIKSGSKPKLSMIISTSSLYGLFSKSSFVSLTRSIAPAQSCHHVPSVFLLPDSLCTLLHFYPITPNAKFSVFKPVKFSPYYSFFSCIKMLCIVFKIYAQSELPSSETSSMKSPYSKSSRKQMYRPDIMYSSLLIKIYSVNIFYPTTDGSAIADKSFPFANTVKNF